MNSLKGMKEQTNSSVMMQESGDVEVRDVTYFENTIGYLASPKAEGSYPGVVMVHEWWGLNDNIRAMARELAKDGYIVLAVDMFGKVATTSDEARAQISSLDGDIALLNLKAAKAYLKSEGANKIASLGWCFGGGQSLRLALSGEPLDATVIYYGTLVTDEKELEKIKWPVLGIFGETDTSIPVETVNKFKTVLTSLGIQNSIHIYPGVGHAFANPSGMNYAPEETKDAWEKTVTFLEENLK